MVSHFCRVFGAVCLAGAIAGCGGSEFDVAKTSGEVVANGEPVIMGTVLFTPVGSSGATGKPAVGKIEPDGTFVLSTYGQGDGAIVGKNRVSYSPPEGVEEEDMEGDPDSAEGMKAAAARVKRAEALRELGSYGLKEELIVEVKPGEENRFTIELTPGVVEPEAGEGGDEEIEY